MPDPKTLVIHELFPSIQGEGSRMGLPCTFIRMSGCNLRCDWCDTPEAWSDAPGRVMTLDEIRGIVGGLGPSLVCITGGEPLLQKATPALAKELCACGYEVLVETNGTQDIGSLPVPIVRVMDVKCPSSRMSRHMDWYNLQHLRKGDEVKFVLASRNDYEYARDLIEKHLLGDRAHILMSAVGGRLSHALLAEWILWDDLPVRMQVQLHKVIWPDGEPRGHGDRAVSAPSTVSR